MQSHRHAPTITDGDRIIRPKESAKLLGISTSRFYDFVNAGLIPRPFPIVPGGRASGNLLSEIQGFIACRAEERDNQAA